MGMAASAAPAMISPKSVDISSCRVAMLAEMVKTAQVLSVINCRK